MKIRAYVSYSERTNTHYYTDFTVVDELPKIGEKNLNESEEIVDVTPVDLDCDQGNDDVYKYDYYKVTVKVTDEFDGNVDEREGFVCIEKQDYLTIDTTYSTQVVAKTHNHDGAETEVISFNHDDEYSYLCNLAKNWNDYGFAGTPTYDDLLSQWKEDLRDKLYEEYCFYEDDTVGKIVDAVVGQFYPCIDVVIEKAGL